jgi:hypothetical protein
MDGAAGAADAASSFDADGIMAELSGMADAAQQAELDAGFVPDAEEFLSKMEGFLSEVDHVTDGDVVPSLG